jgi:hypothetical protein
MTLQSNDDMSLTRARGDDALKTVAIGEARGDAGIGTYAVVLAELIGRGEREMSDVPAYYAHRFVWINAEKDALGRERLEKPEGNSLSSQTTKMKTIAALGLRERERPGTIGVLRQVATVPGCQWKYKPLVAAANAIGATLTKDADATDDALIDAAMEAIDNAQSDKAKTAKTELAKIVKAYDKLLASDTYGQTIKSAAHHAKRDVFNEVALMLTKAQAAIDGYEAAIVLGS